MASRFSARDSLIRARDNLVESDDAILVRKVEATINEIFGADTVLPATTTRSTDSTPSDTDGEVAKSTNQRALQHMLKAWDYFEIADDVDSADKVKQLGEEVFGEDAWGEAVVEYVQGAAIARPGQMRLR